MSFALEKPNATTNQIATKVNGAVEAVVTSASDGSCSVTRHIPAADNQPTNYQIEAIYNGDNALNLTLYGKTPDNTLCALCTMLQYYGYKPSTATATLTVEPQTTLLLMANKTPEQIQQEAMQNGTLSFWHEWSWWFPWYRMHFVGKYSGETIIDVGVAALPFADTGYFPDTPFKEKINEWLAKIAWNVITAWAITEFALWTASNYGIVGFGIVLFGYVGYKLFTLGLNWNSVESLYVSLVSTIMSTAISAWTGLCSFLPANLQALAASAESIKNLAFAFLCKLIMIPINIFLLMMTWNRINELGET